MNLLKYIKNPFALFDRVTSGKHFRWMSDALYLKLKYRGRTGQKLNLENPKLLTEKLQWLKIYDRKPEYSLMVDKYEAKKYVSNIIGNEFIIPTYGVWDKWEDIDFEKLPNQFVLKCTHDSGGVVICKDKSQFDYEAARKTICKCLSRNFFYYGREWAYKNVAPRIIAEEYMAEGDDNSACGIDKNELNDYKFYCMNGEPMYCQVISSRGSDERIDFFDMQWNHQEFTGIGVPLKPFSSRNISAPCSLLKMVEISKMLSENVPFVRVDLYEINKKVYFGELTLYPSSGFGCFRPKVWDEILGNMLELPKIHRYE